MVRESIYHTIPNCLRKYRRIRGLKQAEAAQILGLRNAGMISRWEQGRALPSLISLFKLSVLCRTMTEGLYGELYRRIRTDILKRENNILHLK
jgi:transcriptional regulator with XRE-family HTH domain